MYICFICSTKVQHGCDATGIREKGFEPKKDANFKKISQDIVHDS